MSVLGLNNKDGKSTRDKANISNPKVNRGCAPLTANRTSADCVQISLGPSLPYFPLGVYHTGGFNAMIHAPHFVVQHFCTGNSPHKGQWRGALMLSLICAWINSWVNNREVGVLRRHRAHYGVTVMWKWRCSTWLGNLWQPMLNTC